MADNVDLEAPVGVVHADEYTHATYGAGKSQVVKLVVGAPGSGADVTTSAPFPVQVRSSAGDEATFNANGQATMDNSTPVVIASNQTSFPVTLAAGTAGFGKLTANSGVDIGDVDVTSIAAGDNNIGNVDVVSVPTKFVTVSMTTPTDAQDAGDVVAATQIVAACTPGNDLNAILQSVCVIDTDDQKALLTLVFFSANTALGTEDSAPDIDDTEALTVLGTVQIVAADYIDLGGASIANIKNVGLAVTPASGTDDIYMAIYTHATSTPTYASGVLTVRLGFI